MPYRTYKIVYITSFLVSFKEIMNYLADFSSNTAIDFDAELEQQFEILAELPNLFPKVEGSAKHLRKMLLRSYNYIVFYRIDDDKKEVKILEIAHSSRDMDIVLAKALKYE